MESRKGFGFTPKLNRGAFAPGHQPPGAEISQHVHRRDVSEGEEDRVAIGMQGASGVKGSDCLMDGGVAREIDYWHVKSPSGPLKSISEALLNAVREKSCENWKRD